ncbi:BTB/POZ and MATH domain-containing protein 1-like [Triticum urartu]|uniref:BTB/POZ and MATH domain-containing protein 1-like n=1 Tax=Triticum urartu TaxID=4572 RepID=UPI002042BFD3|nr:BTB/POZ and MATH domain-containing protein 1-like [Triticum urartu]
MAHNAAAAADHGQGIRTSSKCVVDGATHDFVVINYPLLDGMCIRNCVISSAFRVGGYDWSIMFYPDGAEVAGYASVYLSYLSEAKGGVRTSFTLTMLDDQGNVHATRQLPGRLHRALKNGTGTDITLLVGGKEFSAHKFMLAAQSPVFEAQLFGSMAKKDMRWIKVVDMEPAIFEMLLHYVYTDSLPPCGQDNYDTATMQHLLVAADRYGLDRLKVMCEKRLWENINASSVMSTLALATHHYCDQLKEACLEFMSSSQEVMDAVVVTDGFQHLMATCPMLDLMRNTGEKVTI